MAIKNKNNCLARFEFKMIFSISLALSIFTEKDVKSARSTPHTFAKVKLIMKMP